MSIFLKIKNLILGHINRAVESVEDPDIMVDQYIRNLTSELGKIKGWTADAVVVTKKCRNNVAKTENEIAETDKLIAMATENNDLQRLQAYKAELEDELSYYLTDLAIAEENEMNMRAMHDEQAKKLDLYQQKRNIVKSRIAVAKTYNLMAKVSDKTQNSFDQDFARMEDKANDSLLRADALLSLSRTTTLGIEDLKKKYAIKAIEAAV